MSLFLGFKLNHNKTPEVLEAVSGVCDIFTPVGPLSLLLTLSVSLFFRVFTTLMQASDTESAERTTRQESSWANWLVGANGLGLVRFI